MFVHSVIDAPAVGWAWPLSNNAAGGDGPPVCRAECRDLLERFLVVGDGRCDTGRDHPVAVVLTLAAAAVVGGMRSFTAIAGWVADTPPRVLEQLYARCGMSAAVPSKCTIWRVVTNADAEQVDRVVGGWLAERAGIAVDRGEAVRAEPVQGADGAAPRSVIAVDGKRVRGAVDEHGNAVHLLAAATHGQGLVLTQTDVAHKTNEIPMFEPMLDGIEIAGMLVTADCLHTQRSHARYLHGRGADFLFCVKDNQCATRRSDTSPLQAGQTRREVCWV